MAYDTTLFIEIIESIQGIIFIRNEYREGIHARFYQGLTGRLCIIDASDEDIITSQGKGYLKQLGLEYLITTLFPDPIPITEESAT